MSSDTLESRCSNLISEILDLKNMIINQSPVRLLPPTRPTRQIYAQQARSTVHNYLMCGSAWRSCVFYPLNPFLGFGSRRIRPQPAANRIQSSSQNFKTPAYRFVFHGSQQSRWMLLTVKSRAPVPSRDGIDEVWEMTVPSSQPALTRFTNL